MKVYHLKRSTHREQYRWMNERMEWNANLKEHQMEQAEQRRQKERAMTIDVCQEIRDTMMTQEEYTAWWKAAPDDGFLDYASDYLIGLKMQNSEEASPMIYGGDVYTPTTHNHTENSIPF